MMSVHNPNDGNACFAIFTYGLVLLALLLFSSAGAQALELNTETGGSGVTVPVIAMDDTDTFEFFSPVVFVDSLTDRDISRYDSLNADMDAINIYRFSGGEAYLLFSDMPVVDELQADTLKPTIGLGIRVRF